MDATILSRLLRRVQMMVGRGRVAIVDDSGAAQIAQVLMSDLEVPNDRFRMAEFGFTSNPPAGSDAIVLHLTGERKSGVVVGTNHQASRPRGLNAGESMLYSQDGKSIYMTASGGIVVEAKGQSVTVQDATVVTIKAATKVRLETPRFECTGDIVDNCDSTGRSMSADRQIYDQHEHQVHNIQTGSSTVTTDIPTVQQ